MKNRTKTGSGNRLLFVSNVNHFSYVPASSLQLFFEDIRIR
jgi:hypothetical protein